MDRQKTLNCEFKILSGLGILLVISGHFGSMALNVGNLYPYDTFHMPLFIFISGYFYKNINNENISNVFSYIKRKTAHLLIPYFIWNFVYGIIAYFLNHNSLYPFEIGADREFSFYRFIIL